MFKCRDERFLSLTGFTLIETLIVVALFAVIGVSLFSSFYMGLKVWKKATSPRYNYNKAIIGLERLAVDLRRSFRYPDIGFFGNKTACSFANIAADKILNVSYVYAENDMILWRLTVSRQQVLDAEASPRPRAVISYVKDFSFGFYGFNETTGNYSFLDSWNSTKSDLPKFVKATVILDDGREIEKFIAIPLAS